MTPFPPGPRSVRSLGWKGALVKKAQTGTGSNLDDTDQEAMASDQSSSSEEEPTQDETSRSGTDES